MDDLFTVRHTATKIHQTVTTTFFFSLRGYLGSDFSWQHGVFNQTIVNQRLRHLASVISAGRWCMFHCTGMLFPNICSLGQYLKLVIFSFWDEFPPILHLVSPWTAGLRQNLPPWLSGCARNSPCCCLNIWHTLILQLWVLPRAGTCSKADPVLFNVEVRSTGSRLLTKPPAAPVAEQLSSVFTLRVRVKMCIYLPAHSCLWFHVFDEVYVCFLRIPACPSVRRWRPCLPPQRQLIDSCCDSATDP